MKPIQRRMASEGRKITSLRQLWQVNKYLWMSIAFVLLYLPMAQSQGLLSAPVEYAWALLLLGLLDASARTYLAIRRGGTLPDSWAWVFTLFDILLISFSIYITRGLGSDLWLLFFVVMIFESLYATPLQKRLLDSVVSVAYLLATLPYHLNHPHELSTWEYARIVFSRLFFLILVSALGRRLSADTEARNREIALLHEQMATTEERARIAREVHDGLGHALVSSILRLELCARLIRKAPEEAEEILRAEVPALRAAWDEGRDLAFHLRPWELDVAREGLADTLRRHAGRFAERTGLVINLKAEESACQLRPEKAFGLTRIVQEALTNIARHAQATTVDVALTCEPDGRVTCVIQDNGIGMQSTEKSGGFGLQAMRERAQALGGDFILESTPASGTRITVTFPQ